MKRKYYVTAVFIPIFAFMVGCTHYGALESDYGKSYDMARHDQVLNPAASINLQPVTGLNGKATEAVMNKYIGSFSKGAEQPAQQGITLMPASPTGTDTYGK